MTPVKIVTTTVYAAVALRFGSTLVTRDREHEERVGGVLPVVTP